MNRNSRKILAVMIVTAALCADRALAAGPTIRPAVGNIASSFVGRLQRNLSRTVSQAKLRQVRSVSEPPTAVVVVAPVSPLGVYVVASPFQFRLPPPVL